MDKRPSLDDTYMRMAIVLAQRSSCKRKKVGCLFVKNNSIIAEGYNGTPSGWDNECEDENGKTKPCVSHAEANAIAKLARSNNSAEGSTVYCTLSPCYDCAKQMADTGINKLVFYEYYNKIFMLEEGLKYLIDRGIKIERWR